MMAGRWQAVLGSNRLLGVLFALCVVRLWVMALPSSFWVDEAVTAFVVQHPGDASLDIAPQVPASVYYWLPWTMQGIFGLSEIGYRIPSALMMLAAIFLIARLAARLIHPQAGWVTAFACLGLRGIDYFAVDARPYALGMLVAAAGVWFLVRWLDAAQWRDGLVFAAMAALLWRVHLVYWPFFGVFGLYALLRLGRRTTPVPWTQAVTVFAVTGVALLPTAWQALALLRQAGSHVIVKPPSFRDFFHLLRVNLVLFCAVGGWLAALLFGRDRSHRLWNMDAGVLIVAWWLVQPVTLYAFSLVTGNSVFLTRYISLALPGVALSAALAATWKMPERLWRPMAGVLALAVLAVMGQWGQLWPMHEKSNWRAAAALVNSYQSGAAIPVICPSPFIEARPPEWKPEYRLPGFLYAHLPVYPIRGRLLLFPYAESPEAQDYAGQLAKGDLANAGRFLIYGGAGNTRYWLKWFRARPELAGWKTRLWMFGDVYVVLFSNGTV